MPPLRREHRGGCFGCLREPAPNAPLVIPRIARVFVGIAILEGLLLTTLSALLFLYHDPVLNMGQVYAVLGLVCVLSQSWYLGEAVLTENKPQFFAFHVVSALLTSFIVFQAIHNPTSLGPLWFSNFRWIVVGVKCAFEALYLALAVPVWRSFGFWAYKVVGGSLPMIRAYNRYRTFLALLKLDLFAAVLLLLLAKAYLLTYTSLDFILGVVSILVSMIFAVIGWVAVTKESKPLVFMFIVASTLQPAYVGYRLYDLYDNMWQLPADVTYPQFAIIGGLGLLLRAGLVAILFLCSKDFGIGLRQMVFEHNNNSATAQQQQKQKQKSQRRLKHGTTLSGEVGGLGEHLLSNANAIVVDPVGGLLKGVEALAVSRIGGGGDGENGNSGGGYFLSSSSPSSATSSSPFFSLNRSRGSPNKTPGSKRGGGFLGRLAFTVATPKRWAFSPVLHQDQDHEDNDTSGGGGSTPGGGGGSGGDANSSGAEEVDAAQHDDDISDTQYSAAPRGGSSSNTATTTNVSAKRDYDSYTLKRSGVTGGKNNNNSNSNALDVSQRSELDLDDDERFTYGSTVLLQQQQPVVVVVNNNNNGKRNGGGTGTSSTNTTTGGGGGLPPVYATPAKNNNYNRNSAGIATDPRNTARAERTGGGGGGGGAIPLSGIKATPTTNTTTTASAQKQSLGKGGRGGGGGGGGGGNGNSPRFGYAFEGEE